MALDGLKQKRMDAISGKKFKKERLCAAWFHAFAHQGIIFLSKQVIDQYKSNISSSITLDNAQGVKAMQTKKKLFHSRHKNGQFFTRTRTGYEQETQCY